jgi:hypothetical protein
MGSETTSPYWYTIGDWSYMMFVVQHPYEVDTFHAGDPSSWASLVATNPEGKMWSLLPVLYVYTAYMYSMCVYIIHLA